MKLKTSLNVLTTDKIKELIKNMPKFEFGWQVSGDKVVILPLDEETKTTGGIIIPDTSQEKPKAGYIAALGPDLLENEDGTPNRRNPYFIGQLVQYGKYAGTEYTGVDGNEYIIMREHDIQTYQPKP